MAATEKMKKAARADLAKKSARRRYRHRFANIGDRVVRTPAVQIAVSSTVASYLRLVNITSRLDFDPSDPYVMNASIARSCSPCCILTRPRAKKAE